MPEGPEIRRAADQIEAAIQNQSVVRLFFGFPALKHWELFFIGSQVLRVETYGKAMLTRFDNGLSIYSHNQLYGRWVCCEKNQIPESKRQLRLAIHTATQSALLYSASDIAVLKSEEVLTHPFLKKLGKDVLSDTINIEYIIRRLMDKHFVNRQIGGFLCDQSFVAGLGNYLRCEILFYTGIHPKTKAKQLSILQLEALAQSIIALPRQSYCSGGITNDLQLAQKLMDNGASFEQARFYVFRRQSLPCYRCGNDIQRQSMGGQPCYYCPTCQALRR